MIIPIAPVNAFPASGVYLRVNDGHVRLDHGADFQWQILDSGHQPVSMAARNTLTDDQYAAWVDDAQVPRWVAENVGLVPTDDET